MRRSRPRSSSADRKSWGPHKPLVRRSVSESRSSAGMVNMLQRGMSPACGGKMSLGSLFSRNRGGSLLDNKRVGKDPRPLGEKAYQTKCIAELVETHFVYSKASQTHRNGKTQETARDCLEQFPEFFSISFLVENNFPFSADVKKLMSPSKKDFERIFEFLYRYWDPKYVVGKIEDDATKILKMLNYPFIVIKSTFVSVNRMTWPSLLGILMWLMELNKFALNLDISAYFQTSDFDTGKERYKFRMYNLQNYSMNIDDPEKDIQFFTSLLTARCKVDKTIEELEAEYITLQEKRDTLQKEEDALKRHEKDNDVVVGNMNKYVSFLTQMKKHIELKEQECLELEGTLKQKEIDLQPLMKAIDEKEKTYNQQGYDGQQKQQFLLAQKQNLSKELEEKCQRLSKEEKAYWDLEIENSTLLSKVLTMSREFNEQYASLKPTVTDAITPLKRVYIPSVNKLCQSFEVDLPEFEIVQRSGTTDYSVLKSQIMPALDKLKAYLVKQKDFVRGIAAAQNNGMHELEMKLSELKIRTDVVKAQSAQKQREKDSNAKEFEQEIFRLQAEHEAAVAALAGKQKYLNALEKQIDSLKQEIAVNNGKIQEARTMYGLYRAKAKDVFQKMMKDIKDEVAKYDELHALIIQKAVSVSKLMKNSRKSYS